ncbi:MAG: hypothetical protein Sapg2KO_37690 [Saprospiraceae bacterium]
MPFSLLVSGLSAVAASLAGWILSREGGYEPSVLNNHRWLGLALTVGILLVWVMQTGLLGKKRGVSVWSMTGLLTVLLIVGHLGGTLTHGAQYLSLKAANVGTDRLFSDKEIPTTPDSIRIYAHLVRSILDDNCVNCHNADKMKGGLRLDSYEGMLKGGETGPAVVKGQSSNSELFHRITMDPNSRKFMPPKGDPLSYPEIRLIDYWIKNGLSQESSITNDSLDQEIKGLIENYFGLSLIERSMVEKRPIGAATPQQLEQLRAQGYLVQVLSDEVNYLEVSPTTNWSKSNLKALVDLKKHISWLDLANQEIDDQDLKTIARLPHVTRLQLSQNPITDAGIRHLSDLQHLESLNVYGTKISDDALEIFAECKSLRYLYLWETKISEAAVAKLRRQRPDLKVDDGSLFEDWIIADDVK